MINLNEKGGDIDMVITVKELINELAKYSGEAIVGIWMDGDICADIEVESDVDKDGNDEHVTITAVD